MLENHFTEKDWKLFKEKLGKWQEAYMDKLNKKYIDLLGEDDKNPSDKFWSLYKQIRNDKRRVGVRAEVTRSKLDYNLAALLVDGAITDDDLQEFSKDLQDEVKAWVNFWNR